MAQLTHQQKLKSLYRQILREAQRFPSIKRDTLIEDIRAEWRVNSAKTDPAKVSHSIELALRGLETLQKYTNFDKSKNAWKVDLEQDPFGAGQRGGVDVATGDAGSTPQQQPGFIPFGSTMVQKLE